MERVNFNYSMKNIPIPSKNAYLKKLIFKLESFIKRIWWKAYFLDKPNKIDDAATVNNFGFKSVLTPPEKGHLKAFEEDLYDPVHNIEFKRANTVFQNQLNKHINMINKDPLLFIPVDKSNNLNKDTYSKLMQDDITKPYRKHNVSLINNINKEAKVVEAELKLDDRIVQFNHHKAFVTLKDHT